MNCLKEECVMNYHSYRSEKEEKDLILFFNFFKKDNLKIKFLKNPKNGKKKSLNKYLINKLHKLILFSNKSSCFI